MKTSRWVFAENLRSMIRWMDRWEEAHFASLPDFIEHLDRICICEGRNKRRGQDCDPHRCHSEFVRKQ